MIDRNFTLLVVGVISRRSATKLSISLPRSFLQLLIVRMEISACHTGIFGCIWCDKMTVYSPNSNVLGMLCHADSRILGHAHVTNHHILQKKTSEKALLVQS